MYLLMKCEELDDQYECDAKRIPLGVFETIEEISALNKPYLYEIYEISNTSAKLIRDYEEVEEFGLAFCVMNEKKDWWEKDGFEIVKKYPDIKGENITKNNIDKYFPKEMRNEEDSIEDIVREINNCGSYIGKNNYCITSYEDHIFYCPY